MKNSIKKILIIAAHPDDEVLGCGGLIAKNIKLGNLIKVVFLAEGVKSRFDKDKLDDPNIINLSEKRNNNALKSLQHLGVSKSNIFLSERHCCRLDEYSQLDITKNIEKHITDFKPNQIFTHWPYDANIDHRIAYSSTITASRPVYDFDISLVASFEVLSSTDWNFNIPFSPNYFIDISNVIEMKIEAMKYYEDEIREFPHSRSEEAVRSLAKIRGVQIGVKYAEAFNLIRLTN